MHRSIFKATRCKASPWTRPSVAVSYRRNNSTSSDPVTTRLQSDLKIALKSKDSFSATTIRSVLAEVYAAQKQAAPTALKPSDIISIVRKAEQRRLDSMRQFEGASRPDLAQREQMEATLLASYLPAVLPTAEIDAILRHIISESLETENVKKGKGLALKTFYSQVDKNVAPREVVKQRLDELWPS